MDASERPPNTAGGRAAGRHRDYLREPAQRYRGCRRAGAKIRQCGNPARRFGELPFVSSAGRGTGRGASRRRAAGSCHSTGADARPRRCRGDARDERVQRESRIPVIAHLEGLCHTYVDAAADPEKARNIVLNAKMRRVSICGATETLLVDRAVAKSQLPAILAELRAAGCELRGDPEVMAIDPAAVPATDADWRTEYLDAILSVHVVDGVDGAIEHIARFGSHHTDAIITENDKTAERFLREVDSAIVLVNASTQFADGGEFGMGAEIGISTQRLPPRGPVGAEQLTTYKYLVRGTGQVRP